MLVYEIFLVFIIGRVSVKASTGSYVDLPKCCDVGSVFVEQNNSLSCNQNENSRVIIQLNALVDLNDTEEYECVEALNQGLFVFRKRLNEITQVKNISDQIFPKCCPVNYVYDPFTHSCEEHSRSNGSINATFLWMGLPRCQIIYDYQFDNITDIEISDEDNQVYFKGKAEGMGNERYCMDETVNRTYVVRVCENFDVCKSVLCLHKCCPDGQSFVNGSHCKDTFKYGMNLSRLSTFVSNVSVEYAIIHGYKTGVYIPRVRNYHLDDQGNFYSVHEKIGSEVYSPEEETYCIEHATKGGKVYGHTLFRVIPEIEYMEKKFLYNRWAMVVSNIFLTVTVLYYIFSNETRKAFGKALVSFCFALFILFVIIIYCTFTSKLNRKRTMATCKTIGFLIIYLSYSCFVWLQVMCYDIYWTFGSSKRYSSFSNKKRRDVKKFIYYSLYGWGVPFIMTLILLLFHFVDVLPPSIKIKMGETKCLIERGDDNYAEILFYIIPISLLESVNIVFFIRTVRYCLQVKRNIEKMNQSADIQKKKDRFRARKERFGLVIKLSFIMGIFYLFEVVSSFYDFKKNVVTEYIEIIWDFFNCLQGFFIFVIFICKTKFLKKCSRNIAIEKIRKISLTASTRTTGLSSEKKSSRESKRKYSKEEANNKFG